MGEELLARVGLGDHCDRLGGPELEMAQWKWRAGDGYEGARGCRVYRTW